MVPAVQGFLLRRELSQRPRPPLFLSRVSHAHTQNPGWRRLAAGSPHLTHQVPAPLSLAWGRTRGGEVGLGLGVHTSISPSFSHKVFLPRPGPLDSSLQASTLLKIFLPSRDSAIPKRNFGMKRFSISLQV